MVAVAGKKSRAIPALEKKKEVVEDTTSKLDTLDLSLARYIKVWDDALPQEYCEKVISLYAEAGEYQIVRTDSGRFVSCNIDRASTQFEKVSNTQKKIIEATLPIYAEVTKPSPECLPEKSVLEDTHIYHFRNETDVKTLGVDINHIAQAKRYLTLIWFLSEDEDFYLKFDDIGTKVESKVGRLLIFPSTWTYPYSIHNSENQNYLMKTHLNWM
jgi:uncharacterized protein YfbU (UPF0304 family)